MGLRFPNQKYGNCFFISTTFREWQPLGDTPGFYERMADSLNHCLLRYNAKMIGYIFMPTHVHLLPLIAGAKLSPLMRDFKKYVAQKVADDLYARKGIWMPRYDRVAIVSREVLITKLQYIHENPVKKSLVASPVDWKWSSAIDYYTSETGVVPIFKDW